MGLFDLGNMILKDLGGIVDGHGNNGTACLFRNLEASLMKFHKGIVYPVSGSLRENADGNTGFYLFNGSQYGFQPLLNILSVKEKAVNNESRSKRNQNIRIRTSWWS